VDPGVEVAAAVAQMPAHPQPPRAGAPIPPGVQGGHRHPEQHGDIVDAEESITRIHPRILSADPFTRVSETLSPESQKPFHQSFVLTGVIGYGSFRRDWLQRSGEMCDTA
jgi:hypothetical protein